MLELIKAINPILIAIVTVFGTASIKFYFDNKSLVKKNIVLKDEIKDKTLEIQIDLQVFNDIKSIVESMLFKTKADRFVILTCTNGKTEMKFATAIYEHHKNNSKIMLSIGATNKYIKFAFDSEYRKMLKQVEKFGHMFYNLGIMEDSDLKSIYEIEDVKHSGVYFLFRGKIDEDNDRIFYCSLGTHETKEFTNKEKAIFKMNIDKLKYKFERL